MNAVKGQKKNAYIELLGLTTFKQLLVGMCVILVMPVGSLLSFL